MTSLSLALTSASNSWSSSSLFRAIQDFKLVMNKHPNFKTFLSQDCPSTMFILSLSVMSRFLCLLSVCYTGSSSHPGYSDYEQPLPFSEIDWSELDDIVADWTDNPDTSSLLSHATFESLPQDTEPRVIITSPSKRVLFPSRRAKFIPALVTETSEKPAARKYLCRHQPCSSNRHTDGLCRRHFRDVLEFDTYEEAFRFSRENPSHPDVVDLRSKYYRKYSKV